MSEEEYEDYANTVDVSPYFWELINDIINLDYKTLKKTPSFNRLVDCMEEEDLRYCLKISDDKPILFFNNINELFYGTLHFCRLYHNMKTQTLLLEHAIKKMELFVQTDDMTSLFTKSLTI